MDAHHQLHLLGDRISTFMDRPDAILPSNDDTRAAQARSHRFPSTASRATESLGILVSSYAKHTAFSFQDAD